ncbi:hypothetical protein LKL90_03805 [Bacillus mobilis]|uniref:Uncharacterized protein n=1 Tax=Bacillus paramobilis TaxID=2817477 RepID=A0ABZ2VNI0_9BACI|nr:MULTISPECIES: hypothetical protein [Bacillus]MCC2459487.1 hypothetical protein [Bacillus mobilis]BCD27150.1 hypothetical protein BC30102_0186 [Bacillus cereus]
MLVDPFTSRFAKRFFITVGSAVGLFLIGAMINSEAIAFSYLLALFGIPIYFVIQDNKGKNSCKEIVRNKYNQTSILTLEVFHHSDFGWGCLTLTKEALIFVPKKGDIIYIPHSNYAEYGYKGLGTGDYITTSTKIGNTNMSINNTSEKKAPVFYLIGHDGTEVQLHTRKNKQMYNAVKKALGRDNSHLKSNY